MDYIRMENNAILFENDGEVLRIEPWGKDSLRVRAAMMREIQDTDYALLPAGETEAVIQIKDGFTGSITAGLRHAWRCANGKNAVKSVFITRRGNCS